MKHYLTRWFTQWNSSDRPCRSSSKRINTIFFIINFHNTVPPETGPTVEVNSHSQEMRLCISQKLPTVLSGTGGTFSGVPWRMLIG